MTGEECAMGSTETADAEQEVASLAGDDPSSTPKASRPAGNKATERYQVDFENCRIMRFVYKGDELVGTFVACHSILFVVARFQIQDVAQVLVKEDKFSNEKVEERYHIFPRTKLGKRSIWDAMTALDVLIESSSERFLGWLADQLVQGAAEAPKLPTFERAGFLPEQGMVVFEDGVLDGGVFLPADTNGLVFARDQKPLGIIVRSDTRSLFPISAGFREFAWGAEPDRQAYNDALMSVRFCRGDEYVLHLMNEVVRFCVTVENARECSGASFPFSYFSGPSDVGKSQAARDLMYLVHGHSRSDEQAYSLKGSFPRLRGRLCASTLPQLVNEANKKHDLALVESSELHDKHFLPLYDRSDFSNANEIQKPIGTVIFTGTSFEPTAPEVEKRTLASEIPSRSRKSEEASMHFRKLEETIHVIRQRFVRFIFSWSLSPSSFSISVMENARRARSELAALARSMNLDIPSTDLGHYALIIAAAKASDENLHMHEMCVSAVTQRMQERGQGRTFANTLDALKLVGSVLLGISRADANKDEFGIAEINASRTKLSISISKAKDRAKVAGRMNMPITESMVLRELGISKAEKNARRAVSPMHPWVEWHRDQPKARNMRLNGACGLTFHYAEDSGMPSILRDACEEIASRFVIFTQNCASDGSQSASKNSNGESASPVPLPTNVLGLHHAR